MSGVSSGPAPTNKSLDLGMTFNGSQQGRCSAVYFRLWSYLCTSSPQKCDVRLEMDHNQLAAPQHSHERLSSPIKALQDQLKFCGVVIIMSWCDSDIDVFSHTSRANTVDKKKIDIVMNTGPPQASYGCGNFSDNSCLKQIVRSILRPLLLRSVFILIEISLFCSLAGFCSSWAS